MTHVVLIDRRHLRVLRLESSGALIETYAVEDPNAAAHERDLRADRPGRAVNTASGARVTLDPKHSAQSASLQRWLKSVGTVLVDKHIDQIVLVASARLLALLRVSLPAQVRRQVLAEVARDLMKHSPQRLKKQLQAALGDATRLLR